MIGFGIDLAGYTTGKTSLAVIEITGRRAEATLLRGSALLLKRESSDAVKEILRQEAAVLRRCLAIGPVAVDIPIDLQDLTNADRAEYIWQLTRRPIDWAMRAMPPLADRIGAPTKRFAAIMREGKFADLLGERLFEAYPDGTLRTLKLKAGSYKGASGVLALQALCGALKVEPHVDSVMISTRSFVRSPRRRRLMPCTTPKRSAFKGECRKASVFRRVFRLIESKPGRPASIPGWLRGSNATAAPWFTITDDLPQFAERPAQPAGAAGPNRVTRKPPKSSG